VSRPGDGCHDDPVEPVRDGSSRSEGRRFRPWTWFWLWCVAGAAAAVAVGGTAGAVFFAVFATAALFLFAVIARIEQPPPQWRRLALPAAASAPLVFVTRGRTDVFAAQRGSLDEPASSRPSIGSSEARRASLPAAA
jgi:hypothetical protein